MQLFGPAQYCSSPALQGSHVWQLLTMQPTPTTSPSENAVTPSPVRATRPTTSWPGTQGQTVFSQSSRHWCRSEWQTPQWVISISISPGPASARSKVTGARSSEAEGVP